jgi:hypothetical protein
MLEHARFIVAAIARRFRSRAVCAFRVRPRRRSTPWYGSVALDMNIVASISFPLCASTASSRSSSCGGLVFAITHEPHRPARASSTPTKRRIDALS